MVVPPSILVSSNESCNKRPKNYKYLAGSWLKRSPIFLQSNLLYKPESILNYFHALTPSAKANNCLLQYRLSYVTI